MTKEKPSSDPPLQVLLPLTHTRKADRNCKHQSRRPKASFAAIHMNGHCRHRNDQGNSAFPAVKFSTTSISPFQILIREYFPLYMNARTDRSIEKVVDAALQRTLEQGSLVVVRDGLVVAAPLTKAWRCVRKALQAESHALLTRLNAPVSSTDMNLAMPWKKQVNRLRALRPYSLTISSIPAHATLTQINPAATSKLNTNDWNQAFPNEISLPHCKEFSDPPSMNRLQLLSRAAAKIEN